MSGRNQQCLKIENWNVWILKAKKLKLKCLNIKKLKIKMFEYYKLKCLIQTHCAYGQKHYNTIYSHKHPHNVIIYFEPLKL
jgi:hypothetical protein